MIEETGRCVAQKITFRTHTVYERHSSPAHSRAVFAGESATHHSAYQTAARLDLKPGEMMAIWDIAPDDHQSFAELQRHLPPVPSRLLVKTAEKLLLELNPAYIHISNRVEDEFDADYS